MRIVNQVVSKKKVIFLIEKAIILIAVGVLMATSYIYPSAVEAQEVVEMQEYILTDGETVTLIEPVMVGEANYGAFEGGPTGTLDDTRINLAIPEAVQRSGGGGFNVPTGAPPSPLFFNGVLVQPWTQKMLRFEEFGTDPLPAEGTYVPGGSLPPPMDSQTGPDSVSLDVFLRRIEGQRAVVGGDAVPIGVVEVELAGHAVPVAVTERVFIIDGEEVPRSWRREGMMGIIGDG